jgi:hypothetical protein
MNEFIENKKNALKYIASCGATTGVLGAIIGGGYALYHVHPIVKYAAIGGMNCTIVGSCYFAVRYGLSHQYTVFQKWPWICSIISGNITGALFMTLLQPGQKLKLAQASIGFGLMAALGHGGFVTLQYAVKQWFKEELTPQIIERPSPQIYYQMEPLAFCELLEKRLASEPWYLKYTPIHGPEEMALRKALNAKLVVLKNQIDSFSKS